MSGSGEERKDSSLTIDRAAFLLLRVKRVFRKKKQQRKEQKAAAAAASASPPSPSPRRVPPPLLRSRTLPAIVVPGVSILQAQIDSKSKDGSHLRASTPQCTAPRFSFADTNFLDPRKHLAHHRLSSPETNSVDAMLTIPSPTPRLSTGSATLGKLAKLLNQRVSNNHDSVPRRLSWERDAEESSMFIPRSSSIDSMVSIDSKRCNPLSRRTPSPLLVPRPPDKPPPLSPSVARRLKGQRAVTGQYHLSNIP